MMMGTSRGRSSYYGGNAGGLGFFGSPSSSERLVLQPAAARRHDDVAASASAAAVDHLADLDEEDVWSAVSPVNNSHHRTHRRPAGPAYAGAASSSSPPARHSAPVNVPEWPAATLPDDGGGSDLDDHEWVPPHEYLQRRWCGAGGATSSSVLEGAGRTLKGRDITRVRDAVWSKTGFLG